MGDRLKTERAAILFGLAAAVRDEADKLAVLESRNTGKSLVEATSDVEEGGPVLRLLRRALPDHARRGSPSRDDAALALVLREPVGVVAQIVPSNYPLRIATWKLAPALCAGCPLVLKPAAQTPLSVLEFAQIFAAAGVPDRVVNIVAGGRAVGEALTTSAASTRWRSRAASPADVP